MLVFRTMVTVLCQLRAKVSTYSVPFRRLKGAEVLIAVYTFGLVLVYYR
jgi:hypothetical protein